MAEPTQSAELARRQGDYLLLDTAPCGIALAAKYIGQIYEYRDWAATEALVPIEQLAGVAAREGSQASNALRRVLSFSRDDTLVGVTIPHGVSVLAASYAQLLPLPALFAETLFSAMLLWHGQPRALVIDPAQLRERTFQALACN